ncbi:hypothetical protein E1264_20410 [Actinomadura sp. KC216]|uniref:hypothetical protein n=1 Tax=Actinomadura sp. KC216 TaxID=2530370 RepID=UPI001052A251|nr:hypothetical protein [Actinomadura sp. KC216]TDB85673.1 hypothetical protein E1264_20410 [Actinomadura sp. KC216]
MSRLPLGPYPGIGYGHLLSTNPGVFVTKYEWLVHPIPVERPESGFVDVRMECPVCGRTFTVRVSSLARARRRQQMLEWAWRVSLAIAVLSLVLMIPAGAALRWVLFIFVVFGVVFAFALYMRLGLTDGVFIRWPTWTRMRGHMLRWPPGTPRWW